MTSRSTLRARLVEAAVAMRGVKTHLDLARLVGEAEAYRLTDQASGSLARTIENATASVEENMDLIRLPEDGVWIEFSDAPRRLDVQPMPGATHPETVGIFACPDPTEPDRIILLTAWDFPGGDVHHSYAAAAISLTNISQRSFLARTRYGKGRNESIARMIDLAMVYHPFGFEDEVRYATDMNVAYGFQDSEKALEATRRDVVLEVPFALAALLLVTGTKGTHSWHESDGIWDVDLDLDAPRRDLIDRIGLGRLRKTGFRRRGDPHHPDLIYRAA